MSKFTVAIVGPIKQCNDEEWRFLCSTISSSYQLHKDSEPLLTEQDAERWLEHKIKHFESHDCIVYRARTQDDRDATLAFLQGVTEFVKALEGKAPEADLPMAQFPKAAILGPIQPSRNNDWFFIYTNATVSHQLHKDSGPHQSEQEAELALEKMKNDYKDSGFVVYRAHTQDGRHATQTFHREVAEFVADDDDEEYLELAEFVTTEDENEEYPEADRDR